MKFSYRARSGILRSSVLRCAAKELLSLMEPLSRVELVGRTWALMIILLRLGSTRRIQASQPHAPRHCAPYFTATRLPVQAGDWNARPADFFLCCDAASERHSSRGRHFNHTVAHPINPTNIRERARTRRHVPRRKNVVPV